ncbi:MAG: TAT-variant-translocated molybdopterin oxidoreductase [Rhodothermales bacterium]
MADSLKDVEMISLPVLGESEVDDSSNRGSRAWRSLDHKSETDEFQTLNAGEFAPGAVGDPTASSRRDFVKIIGASMAMAGLTACRRPVENILPYTRKPEEIIPGIPLNYATSMPFDGVLRPLLVESHEGRPTKVEGNPDHPGSVGAAGVFEQASVLGLYDPDRSKHVLKGGSRAAWSDFATVAAAIDPATRMLVIAEPSSSMTEAALRRSLAGRVASLKWVSYAPAGTRKAETGYSSALGQSVRPRFRFDNAKVIVSFDADFLNGDDPNHVENARSYAESRRVMSTDDDMSRLYVFESTYSLTGGMADHRMPVRTTEVGALVIGLAKRLGLSSAGSDVSGDAAKWLDVVAEDLKANRGASVLVAGHTQPASVHAACAVINAALGNTGSTVELLGLDDESVTPTADLTDTVAAMNSGAYDFVLIINRNPAYSTPVSLGFSEALGKVATSVHVGLHVDETARLATWHVPAAHYLEAWGDGRSYDGTPSVVQPLIAPLYEDAKSSIEVLGAFTTSGLKSGYEFVRDNWAGLISGDFEAGWRRVVHDGFIAGSTYPKVSVSASGSIDGLLDETAAPAGIEVVVRPDRKLYDGSFSNNAWLQELPDPVSKLVWDNVAVMSAQTARDLGVDVALREGKHYADVVRLTANGGSIELPVWIGPGQANGSIAVASGYGRDIDSDRPTSLYEFFNIDVDVYNGGALANGIGASVMPLLSAAGEPVISGVKVEKIDSDYMLASTQDHPSMEGRPIVRMATVEEFKKDPSFAREEVPPIEGEEPWSEYPTLWEDRHPRDSEKFTRSLYHKHQWGMAIDLNACTGCNACVVACQSENNIQVVGKESVSHGREMHWVRLDRYFTGDDVSTPGMVMQPMMCVQCENAPCESVCPVAATVHSPDGLNVMVYNRCIGTRYCANNCPYKVRRFNFFNWTKTLPTQVRMAQNPNVTVRFRGVMEKCTYCIQRIREAGVHARRDDRLIADGEVQTACQQACPSQAISFGNIADEKSTVVARKANPRAYELLAELAIKPRTSYLARLRNPNPALEEAAS